MTKMNVAVWRMVLAVCACFAFSGVLHAQPAAAPVVEKLPHAITDKDLAAALQRFDASVKLAPLAAAGFHRHAEVHLVNVDGTATDGTIDGWQLGEETRLEQHAPGWTYIIVRSHGKQWAVVDGTWSMRLAQLSTVAPQPLVAERRLLDASRGQVGLDVAKVGGVERRCAQEYALVALCMDPKSGFPVSAIVDGEETLYSQWSGYLGVYYPSKMKQMRDDRVQMEATVRITALDKPAADLFGPLPGVEATEVRRVPYIAPRKVREGYRMATREYGEALVRVNVDEKGDVKQAELMDADSKTFGGDALDAVKHYKFEPRLVEGTAVAFVTTVELLKSSPKFPEIDPASDYNRHYTDANDPWLGKGMGR